MYETDLRQVKAHNLLSRVAWDVLREHRQYVCNGRSVLSVCFEIKYWQQIQS